MSVASDEQATSSQPLFRHSRRPEWGVAVPTWENSDKRAYRFEDGRTRVLKRSFTHLMKPVDPDSSVPDRVVNELQKAAMAAPAKGRRPTTTRLKAAYPFEDQVKIFRKLFPDGFQGAAWKDHYRDNGSGGLKRHRDPAVELGKERLAQSELDELIASGRTGEIVDRAVEVMETTSLVQRADAVALNELEGEQREAVGEALRDLLYGDEEVEERFGQWVQALRKALGSQVRWRFATALQALVSPEEHPCVHHSVYRKQAAVIAPERGYPRKPGRTGYRNFRHVAEETRDKLEREGFKPKDLLDVHDFIWTTLRPAAAKELEES